MQKDWEQYGLEISHRQRLTFLSSQNGKQGELKDLTRANEQAMKEAAGQQAS